MKQKDVRRLCGITKKALDYYEQQGLILPQRGENGYREYSPDDLAALRDIVLLRRLGLSTSEIRQALAAPDQSAVLAQARDRQQCQLDQAARQLDCLRLLAQRGLHDGQARLEIEGLLEAQSIRDRLRAAFPGKYGLFISVHFGKYLTDPLTTEEQRQAYGRIVAFLDRVEDFAIPDELAEFLHQAMAPMDQAALQAADQALAQAAAQPQAYLEQHAGEIEEYLALRSSPEFEPFHKLRRLLLDFQRAVGYQGFLKDLELASPAYRRYQEQLREADRVFRQRFPQQAQAWYEEEGTEPLH